MILRRASRTEQRFVLGSALAFSLPFGANLTAFAQAPAPVPPTDIPSTSQAPVTQVPSPSATPAPPPSDALKAHDQELDAARAQQRATLDAQIKLKREIDAIGADRAALNQQLIDSAAHVRDVEANIDATQARLA